MNRECIKLKDLSLRSGERVVEITVWKDGQSIMLLLIKLNLDNSYQTELWKLHLYWDQHGEQMKLFEK